MSFLMRNIFLLLCCLFLSSCFLKTRQQVKNEKTQQEMSSHVVKLQRNNADYVVKIQAIEDGIQALGGRTEVLEKKITEREQAGGEEQKKLHEKVNSLSQQMVLMRQALSKMERSLSSVTKRKIAQKKKQGNFSGAEAAFAKKQWKAAILGYQKYIDLNPKGKYKSRALYHTGVCFQKLGNKEVAETFFRDVIGLNPKSSYSKKARSYLKQAK